MIGRKKPTLDARHYGAHYGAGSRRALRLNTDEPQTLAEAEIDARSLGRIETSYDLGEFRDGWYVGVAMDAVSGIQSLLKYLRRDQVESLGVELAALRDKYDAMLKD